MNNKDRSSDLAAKTKALRRQTCELLKLDPDKLTPADEVLVARCGALRLLVSDLEAAQMRGETIDVGKYIAASTELENLLRTDRYNAAIEYDADGKPIDRRLAEARKKLAALLGITLETDEEAKLRVAREREDEVARRDARIKELEAKLAAAPSRPVQQPQAQSSLEQQTTAPNVVPIRPADVGKDGERMLADPFNAPLGPPSYTTEPWGRYAAPLSMLRDRWSWS